MPRNDARLVDVVVGYIKDAAHQKIWTAIVENEYYMPIPVAELLLNSNTVPTWLKEGMLFRCKFELEEENKKKKQ